MMTLMSRTIDGVSVIDAGEPRELIKFFEIFTEAVRRSAKALDIEIWRLRIIESDLDKSRTDHNYDYTAVCWTKFWRDDILCIKQTLAQEYDATGPHCYHGRVEMIIESDNAQIITAESRAMFAKLAFFEYYAAIKAVYTEYTTRYIDAPMNFEGGNC